MDKIKGGEDQGLEMGMAGVGWSGGGMEITVLEQNFFLSFQKLVDFSITMLVEFIRFP